MVAIGVGVAVAFIPGLDVVGVAFLGGMFSGATAGGLGAALNGGDVFSGAVTGGIFGAVTGLATLGVSSAIGYGLNNTFPDFNGGGWRFFSENKVLQGSLADKLGLPVEPLINGVSNLGLVSASTGGLVSSLSGVTFSTKPIFISSKLEYYGRLVEYRDNRQYVYGKLTWIDSFSDGSIKYRNEWQAVSGPWGSPVPCGVYPIRIGGLETGLPGYCRNGVDFFFKIFDSFDIHPDQEPWFGTRGCIGIQESASKLLEFYRKVKSYIRHHGVLQLYVNYY
ncbi:MAG TPA: hypothetical protein P5320_09095 [Bacteroidales bacterium]|nr:hypothetical protein [Bacteroidales bacterium]HOK74784.1 hypothetical protein [Bacteroidales bacterium]HOM41701.1 hypothetical protein [Bacteroidales bacterium]HPP93479.1 hypothetical protein [Bacteroidales bacterium]HQG56245.1 hypothetical protein [Bacteroidales bacterium]